VPAKSILVEEAPGVTQAQRKSREDRGDHPPSTGTTVHRAAVESPKLQLCQTESRSRAGVGKKKVKIRGPEETKQTNSKRCHLFPEWKCASDSERDVAEQQASPRHQPSIAQGRSQAASHRCGLQGDLESWTSFRLTFFWFQDYSTQRRCRWLHVRYFNYARRVENRVC